jgi:hypothetical protein
MPINGDSPPNDPGAAFDSVIPCVILLSGDEQTGAWIWS